MNNHDPFVSPGEVKELHDAFRAAGKCRTRALTQERGWESGRTGASKIFRRNFLRFLNIARPRRCFARELRGFNNFTEQRTSELRKRNLSYGFKLCNFRLAGRCPWGVLGHASNCRRGPLTRQPPFSALPEPSAAPAYPLTHWELS